MMGSGGRMKIRCRSRDRFMSQQEERGESTAIGVTGAKKEVGRRRWRQNNNNIIYSSSGDDSSSLFSVGEKEAEVSRHSRP